MFGHCELVYMKNGLLTERQKEVLRYRRQGLTQQQIADIIGTSKANVCTIEKSALENVRRAHETLQFMYTLDARFLCVIPLGADLLAVPETIFHEASGRGVKVRYDTIGLINRLRESIPQHVQARFVKDEIQVYLNDDGEIYFE
jgi:HTH-type transcriptional regulator, fmd operon transcriptional regulator